MLFKKEDKNFNLFLSLKTRKSKQQYIVSVFCFWFFLCFYFILFLHWCFCSQILCYKSQSGFLCLLRVAGVKLSNFPYISPFYFFFFFFFCFVLFLLLASTLGWTTTNDKGYQMTCPSPSEDLFILFILFIIFLKNEQKK